MGLESAEQSGIAQTSHTIFSLPRELRNEIWTSVISNDMHILSKRHDALYIYLASKESRQLTIPNLLRVSKSINAEFKASFGERRTFSFQSSTILRLLLECGSTSWVSPRYNKEPSIPRLCPKIMFQIKHISISPHWPVCMARWRDNSSVRLERGGLTQTLHAKSLHGQQWGAVDPGAEKLLKFIHKSTIELRSLEISATLLLNIGVVRQLRKLRGVDLHLAVFPRPIKKEVKFRKLSLREKETPKMQPVAWLGETADTDIVLPIYETSSDTVPVSAASLLYLALAIRREVAGTEPVPQRPNAVPEAQVDPPLWIEFNERNITTRSSLPLPTSGWYRYSARDPGVACLEKSQQLLPREPLKRKVLKRQRQELGRGCAVHGRFHRARGFQRTERLDMERARTAQRMGLQGVLVKHWWSKGGRLGLDLLPV